MVQVPNVDNYVSALTELDASFSDMAAWLNQILPACESELERLFLVKWAWASRKDPNVSYLGQRRPGMLAPYIGHILIDLRQQVVFGNVRVDFLVEIRNAKTGGSALLAVECDGHTYHDRTPAQASRDRSKDRQLLRAGVLVARFTTSDIVNAKGALIDLQETILAIGGRL